MVDDNLEIDYSAEPDTSDIEAAAEDPHNAYESEIDDSGVGVNRLASPPDGVDQLWTDLHPSFAKEVSENETP